jgi:predicted house-cleaning noncanonical NTP pyrophosphatase (MazG superfamily)
MLHKFLQNTLYRDKMPDILRAQGSIIHVEQLNDQQYETQLKIKLAEETQEVIASSSPQELIEELADVYEVIDALCTLHNISSEDVRQVQIKKQNTRGGFYQRMFVTIAEHPAGSYGEKYCRTQPEKYPEII